MKTKQKLVIAVVTIATLFFFASFTNQSNEKEFLIVKTIEFWSGVFDSKIVIVDEKGVIQEFELEKLKSKNLGTNTQKINDILNKTSKKGYTLITATSAGWGQDGMLNSFIFEKK